jgi:hypothetical protein
MSCVKDLWLISKYLNNQINQTKTRTQDSLIGIRYATYNPGSNIMVWNFVKDNWNLLLKNNQMSSIANLISDIRSKFNTEASLKDVYLF